MKTGNFVKFTSKISLRNVARPLMYCEGNCFIIDLKLFQHFVLGLQMLKNYILGMDKMVLFGDFHYSPNFWVILNFALFLYL